MTRKIDESTDTECSKTFKDRLIEILANAPFEVFSPDVEAVTTLTTTSDLGDAADVKLQCVQDLIEQASSDNFYAYYRWLVEYRRMQPLTRGMIDLFDTKEIAPKDWPALFATLYYESLFKKANVTEILNNDMVIDRFTKNDDRIKKLLIKTIHQIWGSERRNQIASLESGALRFTSLYNKRGSAGQRRNALRKIVGRDFKLFTALFPVVICNPSSATALFKLEKDLFDVVLFDEASQLRLEDTYTSLYRGKTKIISGDEHQMPPSNYFQAAVEGDDQEYESDEDIQTAESAWSESLLDYARINSYRRTMLGVHYRSEHQDLIEFSNHAFYEGKLMPIPQTNEYTPIEFHEVDGEYEDQTNLDEAKYTITWLKDYIAKGEQKSVGVVTLNKPQSELIKDQIARERTIDADFNSAMLELEERDFFIKNLENVQVTSETLSCFQLRLDSPKNKGLTKALVAGGAVVAAGVIGVTASTHSHSSSGTAGVYSPPAVSKTTDCVAVGGIEDKACTPGAVIVTATKTQICKPGYSKSVRNVPESEKNADYAEYGITSHPTGAYEVDHLISLELGGSNDIANLWPELAVPTPGFHQKDKVEDYLHKQVCDGAVSLKQAQQEIATDWLRVYQSMPAQ